MEPFGPSPPPSPPPFWSIIDWCENVVTRIKDLWGNMDYLRRKKLLMETRLLKSEYSHYANSVHARLLNDDYVHQV